MNSWYGWRGRRAVERGLRIFSSAKKKTGVGPPAELPHQCVSKDGVAMSDATAVAAVGQVYYQNLQAVRSAALKSSAKAVAYALLSRIGNKAYCWPSLKTLAQDAGLSVRAVQYALRALENACIITTTTRKRTDGSRTSNVYRFIAHVASPGHAKSAGQEKQLNTNENHGGDVAHRAVAGRKRRYEITAKSFKNHREMWRHYKIAVANRWIGSSENEMVEYCSAWARCKRLLEEDKADNPGAMLVSIIKRKLLSKFYSYQDEEAGMRALKACRREGLAIF